MIDCHVHTARCGHGEGAAADYVVAARRAGIDVLTFTEHLPLPDALDPSREYSMPENELAEYVQEVRALATSSSAEGDPIAVFAGVEADWLPIESRARTPLARVTRLRRGPRLGALSRRLGFRRSEPP